MNKEKIPNLPMREEETPEHNFKAGRKYGLWEAEQIVKFHIGNTYPINCRSIVEELNSQMN